MRPVATISLVCSLLAVAAGWNIASRSAVLEKADARRVAQAAPARSHGSAPEEWHPRLLPIDPQASTTQATESPAGPARSLQLRRIARDWAARDIGAVLEWIPTLPERERAEAAEAVMIQVAESDPAGALVTAELFGVGLADGHAEHILQLWTEEAPEEAIAWLQSRPMGIWRDRLVVRATWARAQSDPIDAVAIATTLLVPGELRDEAALGIVRHWTARDPAAAAVWVATFPDPLRARANTMLRLPH